uniref:Calpain catalytic domain-containing protein n=1 Tax=Myripristis murdjan TaxID=586833 RepID=A0A667WZX2_9TELE
MPQPSTCTDVINLRYQDGSEGSPSNPAKYNQQDYEHLKDFSLRTGRIFYDSTFPPDMNSLGDLPSLSRWQQEEVKWLRPVEPSFFVEGASRFDFSQGKVGNCWFLAAIASLTFQKDLMVQVVPLDQTFKDYAGIFHFRFWRFGKWVDVVIDDYLPTFNKELLSVRSKTGNEFWVPLLEKAYAKVCGSYADMHSGHSSEAFKDFSGGVHMTYKLKDAHTYSHDAELWASLTRATGCKSMICCGTSWKGGYKVKLKEEKVETGDNFDFQVEYDGSKARLVRLMNPWGRQEWKGKWSDRYGLLLYHLIFNRGLMELEDFCYYFNELIVCCENPNFLDGDLTCQWKCMIYDNSWVAGRNAGGNVNEDTFSKNPQYRLKVKEIDRTEKEDKNVLLSLMQKPPQRNRTKARYNPIGLTLYQVAHIKMIKYKGHLGSSFFRRNRPVKDRQLYSDQRDLIELHSLQPAEYVIIPSTMKPNTNADFVLTVYSKANNEIKYSVCLYFTGSVNLMCLQCAMNHFRHHETLTFISIFSLCVCASSVKSDSHFFQKIFDRADVSKTGTLSYNELQNAIRASGIELDDGLVVMMMFRYSGYSSSTTLENFLPLMLRLENLSSELQGHSQSHHIQRRRKKKKKDKSCCWTNMFMYS